MLKKRVLVLSEGFGSGHTQAAHALSEGIKKLDPSISTRVFELGSFLNPKMAPVVINAYRKTVSKQPKVVGLLYRSNYKKQTHRLTKFTLHHLFYKQTIKIIEHLQPSAVICTHMVPSMVTSRLIQNDGLSIPLYTVITDYDAHGSWINNEVNHYFVAADIVKQKLIEKGVRENLISVTGIPVHPKFWENQDKVAIRQTFQLKSMPTVLIMGGGWGLLHEDSALSYMTKWRESTQIIICTGSNQEMMDNLLGNPIFVHPNIKIVGFTKDIDKLMEVSDLLVTKPGGMTCTEGFSKALPMLFYEPIPGQEEENCHYFINLDYGDMLMNNETVDRWFNLIHDAQKLAEYKQKLIRIRDEHYEASKCAKTILQHL